MCACVLCCLSLCACTSTCFTVQVADALDCWLLVLWWYDAVVHAVTSLLLVKKRELVPKETQPVTHSLTPCGCARIPLPPSNARQCTRAHVRQHACARRCSSSRAQLTNIHVHQHTMCYGLCAGCSSTVVVLVCPAGGCTCPACQCGCAVAAARALCCSKCCFLATSAAACGVERVASGYALPAVSVACCQLLVGGPFGVRCAVQAVRHVASSSAAVLGY